MSSMNTKGMRRTLSAVLTLGLTTGSFALAADPATTNRADSARLELDHLDRLVRVSEPQISADGKSIVVAVQRAETESNRWAGELILVDVASGRQRPLTRNRKGVQHPRWSPSGDRLAFLATSGEGKAAAPQIFVLPMNGGDAQQITHCASGVHHFAWRPDGAQIAFAAADEAPDKKEIEKGNDAFEVGNDDLFTSATPTPVHIWLVSAEGGEPRRQTSGSWSLPWVLPPASPPSPLSWSPDGKRLAFVKQATPHTGDSDKTSVQILELASGTILPVTGESTFESFPSFSPDGSQIVYWCYRDRDPLNVNDLFLAPATCGAGTNFTAGIDRCLFQSIWMPDSKSILTGGHDGTRVALWLVPLKGTPRRLNLGRVNPKWMFWVDATVGKNGSIAFVGSEPDHPDELYHMDSADAEPRRLTDFNKEVAALKLGRVESLQWRGPDNFLEDGTLIYPPDYKPGAKLPLVLAIHGGPQAASTMSFSGFGQLLAARGYLVFMPNYRGSDNLGNAYQRAIFNDAGEGPGRDVMSGLEYVKSKGIVDEQRIAVSGWSYGGYMSTWLLGHHAIWKAAVIGAAVTDLTDEYCLSDFNVQLRYAFPREATPWTTEGRSLYREQSPISHVGSVKTPTLILTTTGDSRVPPTQSYKLYRLLKDSGAKVSMVAYPVPGHFPADPIRSRDVYRRWADWLDQHLSATRVAQTSVP